MRRLILIMLMITLGFALVSCGWSAETSEQKAEETILEIRTDIIKAVNMTVNTDITADYGDRVYEFKTKYTGNAEAGEIVILSPEQVAGIKAEVTVSGCTLVYDDVRLDTGALTTGGLSPVQALPALISAWRNGIIESCGFEKLGDTETVSMETVLDGGTSQKTWFDAKTHLPVRAEISDGGVMVVTCVFSNVIVE